MHHRYRWTWGVLLVFLAACGSPVFLTRDLRPFYFPRDAASEGQRTIRARNLRATVTVLTADSLEGRESTYPGQRKAARYLAARFRSLGLRPGGDDGYLQKIPLQRLRPARRQSAVAYAGRDTTRLHSAADYFCASRWLSGDTTLTAPVVFAGYGIDLPRYHYVDYDSLNVRGKWVLLMDGMPDQRTAPAVRRRAFEQRSGLNVKYWVAHNHGAAGVLIAPDVARAAGPPEEVSEWASIRPAATHPRILAGDAQPNPRMPVLYLTEHAADRLLQSVHRSVRTAQAVIDSLGAPLSTALPDTFRADLRVRVEQVSGQNVVGILAGRDSSLGQEYLAVTAHYDHLGIRSDGTWYPGADDNASGTAGVLAIARAFVENGTLPRRAVAFVLFDGEEAGLLGSRYFTGHPPLPLERCVADINLDMIGRNAPDSVYVIGPDMVSRDLDDITRVAAWYVPDMFLDYRYDSPNDPQRIYYRSDHYSFASHDIPAFTFFSGFHPDYHQPTDTSDKLWWPKMEKVAQVAYLTAWGTANHPQPLKKNGVLFP